MKKLIIILGAAALVMASCAKSETFVKEADSNEMALKVVSGTMTKANELTGITLKNTYGIYAAATQKNAAGNIENPKFFSGTEQLFGTTEGDNAKTGTQQTGYTDNRLWHAGSYDGSDFTPSPIYWPIGKVKMDFLAYAMPMDASHAIASDASAATVWKAYWNDANTNSAKTLSFNGVDTYANQIDVLYANANDQTSAANGGSSHSTPMAFNHAQALLIFNVKINSAAVADLLTIQEVAFYTDARVKAMRDDQVAVAGGAAPALLPLADTDVTLKTVGTFTVDNSRNTLLANWTYGASWADSRKKEHYKMPNGAHADWAAEGAAAIAAGTYADMAAYEAAVPAPAVDAVSASNLATVTGGFVAYEVALPYNAAYAQLGETLLIPEQEKVNFTIKYQIGTKTYFYTYNDLRGVWEKGKKYIYNLDINLREIVITESVADFTEALTHTVPPADPGTGDVTLD